MAFELHGHRSDETAIAELEEREGGFDLCSLPVRLAEGATVEVITPIYAAKNV
jgi:hypothetical protein